ncbi:PrsW family intramembrane metalloprotease [Pseudomonadota bacterium]
MSNPILLYIFSGILAFIPALIWLIILFKKHEKKWLQIAIFFGSIFSVVPILLLQHFYSLFPQYDILNFIEQTIDNQNINLILLFISVGVIEEIMKQAIIRIADKKYLIIHTINDSIHFSLIAALGFAFAENIFYFMNIYSSLGLQQLFIAFMFRSLFTTAAHMVFSGFFGYYYGIAKFSIKIIDYRRKIGRRSSFNTKISRFFNISSYNAFKKLTILKGLGIAIILHAIFNLMLQLNLIPVVAIYIIVAFALLQYLLSRKAGALILVTDASKNIISSMAKRDQDVVMELIAMWFKEERYVDVIHICERLLERDPNNKIIRIFKAKANDKIRSGTIQEKIFRDLYSKTDKKSIARLVKEKEEKKNRK